MPGRNMFGMRSEPSAEALAGSGPTITYPAPPSESATPHAIASVAGGTTAPESTSQAESETAQVAGIDISPGFATPATAAPTNMAAAQANGVFAGSDATNPYATPQKKPSGYTFGSKALTPKTSPAPAPATSPYASAESSITPPSTHFAPPTAATSYTQPPASGSGGGFTLPTNSPAVAAITQPDSTPTASATVADSPASEAVEVSLSGDIAAGAAVAPEFSTASTATTEAPRATFTSPATGSVSSDGGYMPGSTATNFEYPTGDVAPTTRGSYYR